MRLEGEEACVRFDTGLLTDENSTKRVSGEGKQGEWGRETAAARPCIADIQGGLWEGASYALIS